MDFKSTHSNTFFALFLIIFLTGCDTELSPDPLRITGNAGAEFKLYYDSPFEYTFGAAGGDGVYRYRYIQNPDIDDDTELSENPVVMNIEVIEGAKAAFTLRATPQVPEGIDINEVGLQKHRFQLELTDGRHTVTKEYDFSLSANKITFNEDNPAVREASVSILPAKNLQKELGTENESKVCGEVFDTSYEKRLTEKGFVYPQAFDVKSEVVVATKTTFYYRITSSYTESLSERAKANIEHARPDADYVDEVRSFTLEPGQSNCIVYVELLDDVNVEKNENLTLEIIDRQGGFADFSSAKMVVEVFDNEIKPQYTTESIVRNPGDKVTVPISITRAVDYPISINFSVDEDSTANSDNYLVEPQSGVLTIAPGQLSTAYTVNISSELQPSENNEQVISITTDIDEIVEVEEPFKIEINEWYKENDDAYEIVNQDNTQEVMDFLLDSNQNTLTLSRSEKNAKNITLLNAFSKSSDQINFSQISPQFELSSTTVNVSPVAFDIEAGETADDLHVVLNVDGLFANVLRGGSDFVVAHFRSDEEGRYQLISMNQYGSEGDDIANGAFMNNGILYIYGTTTGQDFEGQPTSETNRGNGDGFIYALQTGSSDVVWTRLIGSQDLDSIVSIDVNNRELAVLISKGESERDIRVERLLTSTGATIDPDLQTASIVTVRDENPVALKLDSTGSNVRVLLDSDSQVDTPDSMTNTLTRDVQIATFDSENNLDANYSIATDLDDFAKSINSTVDNKKLIVSGDTLGEFEDNTKRGSGKDSFVTILDSENGNNFQLLSTTQFGSPGNDEVIKSRAVSNTKLFVLWKEDYTEPGHSTFRLSPFSIDGKKLSRDPE